MVPHTLPSNRYTGAFERRVARALDSAVPAGAALLVACSGGPDSTAALVAVSRARGGGSVVAACFDHGLRPPPETAGDRRAVDAIAGRLGRRALHGNPSRPIGDSEAAAREARYRWLAHACVEAGATHCVTGHTLDDQAETVLLRLVRGTGNGGLAAMMSDAPWPVPVEGDELRLVRPLLGVRRSQVLAYLDALGIEARYDSTNEALAFGRNRVRHRVLPELHALNPRAEEALAAAANLARLDEEALDGWAARECAALLTVGEGSARLARRPLLELPAAVASRVLRRAASAVGITLGRRHVAALLAVAGRRGAQVSLPGGEARTAGEDMVIKSARSGGGPA